MSVACLCTGSCAAQCGDHNTSNTARLKTLNPMRNKEPEDVMILSLDYRIKRNILWLFGIVSHQKECR